MRCKSCNTLMSKSEAAAILYKNKDTGKVVYNDWCFECSTKYGTKEALDLLDTSWYQFEDLTEDYFRDCDLDHTTEE